MTVTATLMLVSVIAVIAGGLAGLIGQRLFRGSTKKVAHASIFFYRDGANLKAKVAPDPILTEKKWSIDWTIVDFFGLAAGDKVKLAWVDDRNPLTDVETVPKKRIKGNVKDSVTLGDRFTYKVMVNDVEIADPDVEIVQF
jgi:hypothetical protein